MSTERTVLVTGSTDGIGRRTAEKLAGPGVHLLVHGRSAERGAAVVEDVERAGASATFLEADLSSLAGVRALADSVLARCERLDVLVNNAGISKPSAPREVTVDGFESHLAINYLASFLLTRLLQPLLGTSRVVNVVSAAQDALDFDDLMLERGYSGFRAYGQSKLAQVMLTLDLAAEGVTANCLHPGTHLDTTMVRAAGIRPAGTADSGAAAVVALATADGISGRYFDARRESRAHPQAYDEQARERLDAEARRLTALDR
ncbi:NAD(P)-dependent dehydrogenase, short-chain alcohol dehydrogenase family [Saccharopolyspora flava]|uniref:NAD(P)-dependent dehydrogenase, short-chain alcohol dehydrogenase family n=2 Tax=Saccharopolyspora flava TaxID=95161 RepID=A0A1I6QIX3_9PSEU|nr:SDR family NAD(P)-dependent oxidoreductase [Saccharopolyspora flava]SFS52457.1 NAD(P)-dependent dehydrogenase, short-chain alcohol dehydrogenase family [Saccharopolyspora flava]